MDELVLVKHKGKLCRVIVWTKEHCTKSLSKYPNYFDCEEVAGCIRHYFYEATEQDEKDYYETQQEHLLNDIDD